MNGGYGAEEKLRSGWIWAGQVRVVKVASFRSMQPIYGRIAGNDKIGVVPESLQTAIPNVAMNIIIGARGQTKKFHMPDRSQDKSDDDNAPRKYWRSEKLADRQEVC